MAIARFSTPADDDRVRVNVLTFEDGDETGHHVHEFDYLLVPVTAR